MKYLICQEWKNTEGNHAGMVHLCKLIHKKNPNDYKLVIVPDIIIYFANKKLIYLQFKIQSCLYLFLYFFITLKLLFTIKKGDTIFLFEYLLKIRNQFLVARMLRFFFGDKICIYGLAHLTPIRLKEIYTDKELLKSTSILDFNLTLGSSLSEYLISKGIKKEKVITSFHYVDTDYYLQKKDAFISNNLTVILMGMQMRDFSLISEIVKNQPTVKFVLCSGLFEIENYFEGCNNIVIKGFMSEDELKKEMNIADISLNLMVDSVGSNVITTSMAMGLVNIVSNVGSVKDYCTTSNTFFCDNVAEFSEAIKILDKNRDLLLEMKIASLKHSKLFRFENFYQFINNLK
jgi:glycosyltransferase involved in cell wall biosynthesis